MKNRSVIGALALVCSGAILGIACTTSSSSSEGTPRDGGGSGGIGGTTVGTGGMTAGSGGAGSGGASVGATGGAPGSGGSSIGTGGVASGAGGASAGGTTTGGATVSGSGGVGGGGRGGGTTGAGSGGRGGQGGVGGPGSGVGGSTGGSSAGGSGGGAGGATTFVCNQITAMTLTREWFEAGFETDPGIVGARWQLKAREHGYITEWANPNSDFWNEMIESPCASGSTSPDHVVLTVLSWVPACCTTQAQWITQVAAAVTNLRAKYAGLKRVDLMTVIRGPGNMACPMAPVAGETLVIPPELDGALAAVAQQFPGLVFVAPKFEAPNCAAVSGGGPHLTTAGNTAVARTISAYFSNLQ